MAAKKRTRRAAAHAAADKQYDGETRASLVAAIDRVTPAQRLTLFTLAEHPRLLDAVDSIIAELHEGLR
jgi:hypothetical protein